MKIFGPSAKPLKYSSVDTRWTSLSGFQNGAEFNEVNAAPGGLPFETPNDFRAMNIISNVNQSDIPSKFGDQRGMKKIGPRVFTPQDEKDSWVRNRGEW